MKQNKIKKTSYIKIITAVTLLCISAITILFWKPSASENAKLYYEEGHYQKAAKLFAREIKTKKLKLAVAEIIHLKSKEKLSREINELLIDIAFCYSESGDLKKALSFYSELHDKLENNSEQEAFLNFIQLQTALCYSYLGEYNKAIPVFEKLKNWYPQNLIFAYLNSKQYNKARRILLSDIVQDKITQGDDIDAAALNYAMFEYYLRTGQYEKAKTNPSFEISEFEAKLLKNIQTAEYYYAIKEYDKSAEIYEKLTDNPEFSQRTINKIKIKYSLVLTAQGKISEAKNVLNEVSETFKEFYKYSPDIICTKYYYPEEMYKKEAVNLFKHLKLPKESYFHNDINEFCRVNLQYQ